MTKTAAAPFDSPRTGASTADRELAPRRTGGGFGRCPAGKSAAQLFGQGLDRLLILFGDPYQAPEAGRGVDVPLGFRGGDFPLVLVDALIDEAALPGEQAHEVVGLQLVRRARCCCGERPRGPLDGRRGPGWSLSLTGRFRADAIGMGASLAPFPGAR